MAKEDINTPNNKEEGEEGYEIETETDEEETVPGDAGETANSERPDEEEPEGPGESSEEIQDRYLRLYAEFENYKKVAAKQRAELLKYANEHIMSDLLTVIDHLEMALQHASGDDLQASLTEGVEITLKELRSILEKHGLSYIETNDKPFDPNIHHAMSQIDTEDVDEDTVVKEFRKGYMYKERVLRAPLVGVSRKPLKKDNEKE